MLSKVYGSNQSFQGQIRRFKRLDGLGRERTREKGVTNERSLSQENLVAAFESELGARVYGAKLGAKIRGAEVPATLAPPRLLRYPRPRTSAP